MFLIYLLLGVPFYHWYIVPIVPTIGLLAGYGVEALLQNTSTIKGHTKRIWQPIGATLICLSVLGIAFQEMNWTNRYLKGLPSPTENMYSSVGKWLHTNIDEEQTVAYLEIGYLGYYCKCQVIDVLGLVTSEVIPYVAEGNLLWAYDYFKPDYVLYHAKFDRWLGNLREYSWFQERYQAIREFKDPANQEQVVLYAKRQE